MTIRYNNVFLRFLNEYGLSSDFLFSCEIPAEVQRILDSDILQTDLGITLKLLNKLREPKESRENKSLIEYDENHFHVDWYVATEKDAFKLGTKTLYLLAKKFEQQKISGMRFLYSFQSKEIGKSEAVEKNIHDDGDEYHISDRLSFHYLRQNEEVINDDFFDTPYCALLCLEV